MSRRKKPPALKTVYTTHEAATLFSVSLPTVVNWIEAGRIRCHKTPGGHRRIRAADLAAFARENNIPLPESVLNHDGSVRRVLIVDDQVDFAEGVAAYLRYRGGLQVELAESGFEAGLMVQRFRPGVVLMDVTMPDLDGFDALNALRANEETRHIPVVATAAFRDPGLDARVREHDFHAFLEKPMDLELLLDTLGRCLGVNLGEAPPD